MRLFNKVKKSKRFIQSSIIGQLTQDKDIEDLWQSEPVLIPLLNHELKISYLDLNPDSDSDFINEADSALKCFLRLDDSYKTEITALVFNHFVEFKEDVGEDCVPDEMDGLSDYEIWDCIYPKEVLISRRPYNEPDVFINVVCECLWEPEQGLQLVFKKGQKLTRVSEQDGHLTTADAFNIPDNEDKLLSEF